jgi:hypothetical protein
MMDTDWIQKLKVAELKDELKKRGQPMTGKKAELAERLKAYIQEHEVSCGGLVSCFCSQVGRCV